MSFRIVKAAPMGEWVSHAACANNDLDPNAWTGIETNDSLRQRWIADLAKEICFRQCSVRGECLDHALTHNEFGIWGGTDDNQRQDQQASERQLLHRVSVLQKRAAG